MYFHEGTTFSSREVVMVTKRQGSGKEIGVRAIS